MNLKRLVEFAAVFAFAAAALGADFCDVVVSTRDFGQYALSNAPVTMTPAGPLRRTYGTNLITLTAKTQRTSAGGVTTFTNTLWGLYDLLVPGTTPTLWRLSLTTNQSGSVIAAALVINPQTQPPNPATNYYTMPQVDALVGAVSGGIATNVFQTAAGTNVVVETNGYVYTIHATASGIGSAQTNISHTAVTNAPWTTTNSVGSIVASSNYLTSASTLDGAKLANSSVNSVKFDPVTIDWIQSMSSTNAGAASSNSIANYAGFGTNTFLYNPAVTVTQSGNVVITEMLSGMTNSWRTYANSTTQALGSAAFHGTDYSTNGYPWTNVLVASAAAALSGWPTNWAGTAITNTHLTNWALLPTNAIVGASSNDIYFATNAVSIYFRTNKQPASLNLSNWSLTAVSVLNNYLTPTGDGSQLTGILATNTTTATWTNNGSADSNMVAHIYGNPRTWEIRRPTDGFCTYPSSTYTEAQVIQAASNMWVRGYVAAGMDLFELSDGWGNTNRTVGGALMYNTVNFPSGMPWVVEHCRTNYGVKIGFYLQGANNVTNTVSVWGSIPTTDFAHLDQDMNTLVGEWGASHIRSDWFGFDNWDVVRAFVERLTYVADYAGKTNIYNQRPISFQWFTDLPVWWDAGKPSAVPPFMADYANVMRVGSDHGTRELVLSGLEFMKHYFHLIGPGHYIFTDTEMDSGTVSGLTTGEIRRNIGLGALMHSPLQFTWNGLATDVPTYTYKEEWFTNSRLRDIRWDAAVNPPTIAYTNLLSGTNAGECWITKLANGDYAVALWNRANTGGSLSNRISIEQAGLNTWDPQNGTYMQRDATSWTNVAGAYAFTLLNDPAGTGGIYWWITNNNPAWMVNLTNGTAYYYTYPALTNVNGTQWLGSNVFVNGGSMKVFYDQGREMSFGTTNIAALGTSGWTYLDVWTGWYGTATNFLTWSVPTNDLALFRVAAPAIWPVAASSGGDVTLAMLQGATNTSTLIDQGLLGTDSGINGTHIAPGTVNTNVFDVGSWNWLVALAGDGTIAIANVTTPGQILTNGNSTAITLSNNVTIYGDFTVVSTNDTTTVSNLVATGTISGDGSGLTNLVASDYLPLAGGTVSGAVVSTAATTNSPGETELATAGWVRGLFDGGGVSYYATTNIAIGFTNADAVSTVVYAFNTVEPDYATRVHTTPANATYFGSVTTTNRFLELQANLVVAAYLSVADGGGVAGPAVKPEIYYSYDGTNWLGDWDGPTQYIPEGSTNLYSWVIANPRYTATNATGFFIERRMKMVTQTSPASTVTIHMGSSYPSHITMSVATSSSGNAYLAADQTFTGSNTFSQTIGGSISGNAGTATAATSANAVASGVTNAWQSFAISTTNGFPWGGLYDAAGAALAATNGLGAAAFKALNYWDVAGTATAATNGFLWTNVPVANATLAATATTANGLAGFTSLTNVINAATLVTGNFTSVVCGYLKFTNSGVVYSLVVSTNLP